MAKIGELLVKVGCDASALKKGLEESTQKIAAVGERMKSIGQTMTVGVTMPLVAAGAASFKFAADLQDAMGATDQIFKGASGTMKAWADNLNTYYGIAEGEALTYANTMGAMLQNIGGLSEQEAAKQSQTLVQLAGDLSAMFGGTTESAVQALTGALKGNNSMLDNYGMGVNEATIKSKALEMGLISEGQQLDLAGKQAATLALIMEQTADAQGQAAREAEGASGTMKGLITELKNLGTEIGQILLPIITPFIQKLKEIMQGFGEMSPTTQKIIVAIGIVAAAIGPLLFVFGTLASSIGSIIAMLPVLGTVFTVLTGPIGIVIAVIGLLVAAWVKWGDEIKAFIGNIGDKLSTFFKTTIPALFDTALTKIKEFPAKTIEFLGSLPEKIGQIMGLALGKIVQFGIDAINWVVTEVPKFIGNIVTFYMELPGKIWDWLVKAYDNVKQWGFNLAIWAKTEIPKIIKTIVDFFKTLPKSLFDVGVDLVRGLWDGIKSMVGWIGDKVSGFVSGIVAGFKAGFDERSPSKVMADIGKNVSLGLAQGITGAAIAVDKAIDGLVTGVIVNPNLSITGNAGVASAGSVYNTSQGVTIEQITINGNDPDDIWDKFERKLSLAGVRI